MIKVESYPNWGFCIKYLTIGYNDYGYPLFIFQFIFGSFYLTLPWKHNIKVEAGCETPSYGIVYHNRSFMVYIGKKIKFINLPSSYVWIRTSLLLKDKTWEHETKKNKKNFYYKVWLDKRWQIIIPYKHRTSNEGDIDLEITCHITEREWRQKWLKWTKFGAKVKKTLDVDFSEEVGRGRGSWKGGTLGTGFDITKTSNIEEGLKKMEKKYNMFSTLLERKLKIKKLMKMNGY